MTAHLHRAPADCPVCGGALAVSRLGCPGCGTELVGSFSPCPYCALDAADADLLRVFLTSRGNLKEVEKHLGVSYPTARARFNDLLGRLGMSDETGTAGAEPGGPGGQDGADRDASERELGFQASDNVRDQVLAQVAAGTLAPDVAADLLARL